MTHVDRLAAEIQTYCAAHTISEQVGKWARYFREGYDDWGLSDQEHELWTVKEPEWWAANSALGLAGFLKLGARLFSSGKYEEGALAVRFVKHYRDQIDTGALDGLAGWFAAGVRNWAHNDFICGELLAPAVGDGRIPWRALAPWRRSSYKYQRRAVPVALLGALKAGHKIPPLLTFVRPMMEDHERVVQQGLGWFLREAWKKQAPAVEAFLLEWKDRSPRLIFQYATEKMTTENKARFRAAKAQARRRPAAAAQ
jgi:3-methyladenine DNA glycosylase AlkD